MSNSVRCPVDAVRCDAYPGAQKTVLVIGGLVVVCRVADLVAPRRDGGSWFGVLFDFMIGDGDGDGDGGE